MDVVNVKTFGGAVGDGQTDDTNAIQIAADEISRIGGGILYFPPGVYWINQPQIQNYEPFSYGFKVTSNTWILGSGRASVVKTQDIPVVCLVQGVSGIRISNLTFQIDIHDGGVNYVAAIDLLSDTVAVPSRRVSDVIIEGCMFEALNVPERTYALDEKGNVLRDAAGKPIWDTALTLMAILAKSVKELWVLNNQMVNMQIQMNFGSAEDEEHGFGVFGPATIANNHIITPHNLAISAVHKGRKPTNHPFSASDDPFHSLPVDELPFDPGVTGEFVDLIISNNIIEDPINDGGIWVGVDGGEERIKSLKRVAIRSNIIRGKWIDVGSFGIKVTQATTCEDIIIEGNIISGDGTGPDFGIDIDNTIWTTTCKSLVIVNNTVRNTHTAQTGHGIRVNGDKELSDFIISGNRLENTGGIWLRRGIIRDGIITSNFSAGGGLKIEALLTKSQIGPLVVRDNIFKNSSGDGITLQAKDPTTFIEADVVGNKCYNNQENGIQEIGSGSNFDVRYFGNDLRGNTGAGLVLVNPGAIDEHNRV